MIPVNHYSFRPWCEQVSTQISLLLYVSLNTKSSDKTTNRLYFFSDSPERTKKISVNRRVKIILSCYWIT